MKGHETMMFDQAIPAVVYTVGAVKAREITAITTVCTGSYLLTSSSIVVKQFLEVSVPICEPFLHDHSLSALLLFGFLGFVVLHINLISNVFGLVGF